MRARRHVAITPHDSNPQSPVPDALFCTAAGDVVIQDEWGVSVTYAMTLNQELPFQGYIIKSTGTTGTVVGWLE